ncbi:unnamed protein product [Euphydryas editha]|uniref:Uncharacterized protein n=1 Tax=Euphydryas editha TaxID=104508 RepID=A0AAU9U0N3_EUPED|nr:unnamed protein product [Euphydryas editha]
MIPEVSTIYKSEAGPSMKMTAHELHIILTKIFFRNQYQNQNEQLNAEVPYVNSLSKDEINKLIIEYAYRGSDIAYASS